MLHKNLIAAIVVVTGALSSFTAQAITIIQPTFAIASTDNGGVRPAVAAEDGSGLSAALATGAAIPGIYPNHDTIATGMWASSSGDAAPFITFDLGAAYNISGFHVWNFNQPTSSNVGARIVNVSFSTTSLVSGFGSAELFTGGNQLSIAPESSFAGEDRFFATDHVARYVRFDVIANHGNPTYLGGISEIRFFNDPIPTIPEPSTFALLGLGLAGMAWRKRGARRGSQG